MSIYSPDGCSDQLNFVCSDCPDKELGKVRSLFIIKVGTVFIDDQDPAEWAAKIASGDVIIFPATSGSVTVDPKTSDGYGNTAETLDSYTFTMDVHEPNFKNNVPAWNAVKRSTIYRVGWVTETQVQISDVAATFIPKTPTPAGITDKMDINLQIKFVQGDLPVPFTKPAGTFDECIANG